MSSLGMYGLLSSITTTTNYNSQNESSSLMFNPRAAIRRYLFGLHAKTKRSLAEEAECGDEISVSSWIIDGTNPDDVDVYGYTPLLNASALGRLNAVEQLIKNNADVNRKGPFGFTALHAAAQNGHRDVAQYLVEHGADINSQNDDMDTPMHLAISTNSIEIIYLLLRKNANVFLKGFLNKDCIQFAHECGLHDLAKYMEQYGNCMKVNQHKK